MKLKSVKLKVWSGTWERVYQSTTDQVSTMTTPDVFRALRVPTWDLIMLQIRRPTERQLHTTLNIFP